MEDPGREIYIAKFPGEFFGRIMNMFIGGVAENFLKNVANLSVGKVDFLAQVADLASDPLHIAGFYLRAVEPY